MVGERIGMLKGRKQLMLEQRADLLSKYERLVAQIELAERAKSFFPKLKDVVDHDATTLYSELLTSIIHDVMQDYDQQILLTTGVFRNKTTLDIKTVKNGKVENIDDGRGGSISNLLSAGLRFIALYKSANRRFIILDEPECWLAPHLIPRFVNVIEKMSDLIGIQTILISHHASDVVTSDNSKVISIVHDRTNKLRAVTSDNLSAEKLTSLPSASIDDNYSNLAKGMNIGISAIELFNIQSHEDTRIDIGTGLTVINGHNDIGKSVIARSFAAMMENDFKDSLIRHEQNNASLTISLEQGIIKWSFKRKAKTSLYQFIVSGEVIQEKDCKAGEIPEFLNEVLCMPSINGINVHVADQRDPLFILHPSHSPADRAEMLNLGDSFKHLQIMMQLHDDQIRENRRVLKSTKEDLDLLNDRLFYFSSLDTVDQLHKNMGFVVEKEVSGLVELLGGLEQNSQLEKHDKVLSLMSSLMVTDDLQDEHSALLDALMRGTDQHERALFLLSELAENSQSLTLENEHIELVSALRMNDIEINLSAAELVSNCLYNLTFINTREIPNFDLAELVKMENSDYEAAREIENLTGQLEKLLDLQSKLAVCPTCGQHIGKAHSHYDEPIDDFSHVTFSVTPHEAQQASSASKPFNTYF